MMREEILIKMRRYCDYQDRCHQEVRSRLIRMQVYGEELEQVMALLIEEDLLNEERFARSFTRGRYRIKAWGRHRITRELKQRQISDYCIRKAMEEIHEEEYLRNLILVLQRRSTYLQPEWPRGKKEEDLREHALRKGYELHLISSAIQEVLG